MVKTTETSPLFGTNTVKAIPTLGEPICKINIVGYSLDYYKTFNSEGYTILCRLGDACDGLNYFPKTSRIVLDNGQQSTLFRNFEQLVPNLAKDFGITEQAAFEKSVNFLSNTHVTVRPTGLQGKIYKIVQGAQNYIPMAYTASAVSVLKTTGMTGIKIITSAPLTFVGATYIGSIFFGYCGSLARNNSVGLILNSTSYVLSRPMRGIEITVNGLFLTPVSNIVGVPLVLNGIQILAGKGLSIREYKKIGIAFERISNSKPIQKMKKIYQIIKNG